MPNWTTLESSNRLLAAVFAVYDLKPGVNAAKIAAYYGNDATAKAIGHRLNKVHQEAQQLKLGNNQEAQPNESTENENDKETQPNVKPTKSRASSKKSDQVLNGRVKKTAISTPKRAAKKAAMLEIAAAAKEAAAMSEDEKLEETDESAGNGGA